MRKREDAMLLEQYREQNKNSLADFHTHTKYCDGNNTPSEMLAAALKQGLQVYGFSGHGYTPYDESYCMLPDDEAAYEQEVRKLADDYAGEIKILCGVEQDCLAGTPTRNWDYVIGSVHYIDCRKEGGGIEVIDESKDIWLDIADKYFGGDVYAMIERYFETVARVVEMTGADIIGHLDLITKYNAGGEGGGQGALFDEGHPRYVAAWQKAVDKLLPTGVPFEINTGGMSRKYRADAYPAKPIRDYIAAHGGRFILSSDSHNTETLCSRFAEYRDYLK